MSNLPRTNLHNIFATDSVKEEEGTWVEVNNFMGLSIKIRRLRSDAATKDFERRITERYGDGKLRELSKAKGNEAVEMLKLQLMGVLIGWKGLKDESAPDEYEDAVDGEEPVLKPKPELPYSEELAYELLGIKDFREFVFEHASERDAFREKADKDAEGNS